MKSPPKGIDSSTIFFSKKVKELGKYDSSFEQIKKQIFQFGKI
jgi:hypothetical protein